MVLFRVVMLGEGGVGKSAITVQLVQKKFVSGTFYSFCIYLLIFILREYIFIIFITFTLISINKTNALYLPSSQLPSWRLINKKITILQQVRFCLRLHFCYLFIYSCIQFYDIFIYLFIYFGFICLLSSRFFILSFFPLSLC